MHGQPAAFGEQLRRYRMRAGLTQEGLAERAGLKATTISALERGARRLPYLDTRRRLAVALGLAALEQAAFIAAGLGARRVRATSPPAALPVLGNLPVQRTPLIGRQRAVGALRDLLRQDQARLITLTGVGGCGKTRLALRVAHDVADE